MKFSVNWLREWIDPKVSVEQLAEKLTMAGLEVESLESVAGTFTGVEVGEIVALDPHPNADKLRVCQVRSSAADLAQVVCGADNARVGLRTPFARLGALLPGDFEIKKAKLRGVESLGMLCSAKELGLAESSSGIYELPSDAPVGENIRDYMQLEDWSIELGLTPNRADCLGIKGIAQEISALYQLPVEGLLGQEVAVNHQQSVSIKLVNPAGCSRYLGRIIKGVNAKAPSPLWLTEKLRRSGLRSVSALVDITNYVLLELGQPLHAFDLDTIEGDIQVRCAKAEEELVLLDGKKIVMDSDLLVIADDAGPLALAGIMGGQRSACTDSTVNILLESAFFNPKSITGRSRRFGLHTDASHRFERGVDPQLQRRAIERATELLLSISGGQVGPIMEAVASSELPNVIPVGLRRTRLAKIIGVEIDEDDVEKIFTGLAMSVETTPQGWNVTPPSSRFDIASEEDLIEEVARIYGYNKIPTRAPSGELAAPLAAQSNTVNKLLHVMTERGYQEVINYSFIREQSLSDLKLEAGAIPLANPLSEEFAVMRTSLLPGLLSNLTYNAYRQQSRVRLFEVGVCFNSELDVKEEKRIGGLLYGETHPEQWGVSSKSVDFFDIKSDLEGLFDVTGYASEFDVIAAAHPFLHPGRCAKITRNTQPIGWVGELHPRWVAGLDLPQRIYAFELQCAPLLEQNIAKCEEISKFPSVRRDLSLVVDESVTAAQLCEMVNDQVGSLLNSVKLFDVYRGEGIQFAKKSVSIGLILQETSRTLTVEEVDDVVQSVIIRLKDEIGADIRE